MIDTFKKLISSFSRIRQPNCLFFYNRAAFFVFLFSIVNLLIIVRATVIHLFPSKSDQIASVANRQYQHQLEIATDRGNIFDRKREPLAISLQKISLSVNPKIFRPTRDQASALSKILSIPQSKIFEITKRNSHFSWLKRRVSDSQAHRSLSLGINGISQISEPTRYYPGGFAASQVLGFVGSDNNGLAGIERKFDPFLRGKHQKLVHSRDALGRNILGSDDADPEISGNDIHLTIDLNIQNIADKALETGVKNAKAKSGFAIVSDPHTGRLLAIANYPPFDPNIERKVLDIGHRNHALLDLVEPGSVVKPFVIAAAMEKRQITAQSSFFCENGIYRENNWKISDDHPQGTLSTIDVIVHSSNICAFKIARTIGSNGLYQSLRDFGFGSDDFLIDFPGQAIGKITNPSEWKPVRFANIAFGQGFLASGLEIVQAYGSFANGGNIVRPFLIDRIETTGGQTIFSNSTLIVRRVLNPTTAKTMRHILKEVVERGTGKNAQMLEYSSAGKTGTSEKIDPVTKAYSNDKRIASFAGFSPVEDPHLVIYVVVDEPSVKPYYGGTWAAPIFKEIAEATLKYLNVAPDIHRGVKLAEDF